MTLRYKGAATAPFALHDGSCGSEIPAGSKERDTFRIRMAFAPQEITPCLS